MIGSIIIDNQVRKDIFRVTEYAWKNIVPLTKLLSGELKNRISNPFGDINNHVVYIPIGFKVVFFIEDQGTGIIMGKRGLGRCRYLSISINEKERIPNPIAMDMVIDEFGFNNPLHHCVLWAEDFGKGTLVTINALEPVDQVWNKSMIEMLEKNVLHVFGDSYGKDTINLIEGRRRKDFVNRL